MPRVYLVHVDKDVRADKDVCMCDDDDDQRRGEERGGEVINVCRK